MDRVNLAREMIAQAKSRGQKSLSEQESKEILSLYGIPVNHGVIFKDQMELELFLNGPNMAFPIAMKVDSPDILHKTEAGLVRLNIQNPEEALQTFRDLLDRAAVSHPDALIHGISVQKMLGGSVAECVVGIIQDPQFGPVLMYGLGGIWVEMFKDYALRLPPLSQRDAAELMREIKGFKLLEGYRNQPMADKAAVEDVLLKMSALAMELQDCYEEIEMNPLLVFSVGNGAVAADALIRIR